MLAYCTVLREEEWPACLFPSQASRQGVWYTLRFLVHLLIETNLWWVGRGRHDPPSILQQNITTNAILRTLSLLAYLYSALLPAPLKERRVPLANTLLFSRDKICLPARAVTPLLFSSFLPVHSFLGLTSGCRFLYF